MAAMAGRGPTSRAAAAQAPGGAGRVSSLDGAPPAENDWSTYFCTYSYLYHQVGGDGWAWGGGGSAGGGRTHAALRWSDWRAPGGPLAPPIEWHKCVHAL